MKSTLRTLLFVLCICFAYNLKAQDDIKLVTLNLRYGTPADKENSWKNRRKRVQAVFKSYSDGIIATQEALPLQIDDILAAVPRLEVVYRSRTKAQDDGPANAVFYDKKRWKVIEHETFWLSDTPEEPASKSWGNTLPRVSTMVIFEDKSSGRQIKVMNVHLDHRSQNSREKSVELVLRKLMAEADPMPTFVLGDLNMRPTNSLIRRMEQFFTDTFEGEELDGCTYHDYHGGSHCPRIDYIFFQDGQGVTKTEFKIDKWKSKGMYPQDHYPVMASFKFDQAN